MKLYGCLRKFGLAAMLGTVLTSCASVHNLPVNVPLSPGEVATVTPAAVDVTSSDDLMVMLSFSGGGTRAAAFSFGVLQAMDQIKVPNRQGTMLDRIDFVSGVSGGSVTAAYFGLKKRAALDDFRERFLIRNAEERLITTLSLGSLGRAFSGGVNDDTGFTSWLDKNLFGGATMAELQSSTRPYIWINASDIYNRVPFIFNDVTFAAICSDITKFPISNAVAASAAVPIAFAPAVVKAYPDQCQSDLPAWVTRAASDRNAPPLLSSYAKAINRYREGRVPYIKLLDGGLVDNFGVLGLTIARNSSPTPYGPLTAERAAKLRRGMFMVVDAKAGVSGDWVRSVEGPSGADLIMAAVDSTMVASVGASFTALDRSMQDWQTSLIKWRCGLSAAERARYGVGGQWNCRDLKLSVMRVGFDQLEPSRAKVLESVPTRFNLPQNQVDDLIAAGNDVVRKSTAFKSFLGSL